jgi:hypothetical protein
MTYLAMTSFSVPEIVATIAGAVATAKTLYDWVRSSKAERPVITGTLRRGDADAYTLAVKVVRLERYDILAHCVRCDGLTFSVGKHNSSGLWVPGDFAEQLPFDWTVTSQAGTVVSEFTRSDSFDVCHLFVRITGRTQREVCSIKLLISISSNLSRKRWAKFQVRLPA